MDAVGIYSDANDDPLKYRYQTLDLRTGTIKEKTDTTLKISSNEIHGIIQIYLGAIVSADRSEVYWVNDTRPLP